MSSSPSTAAAETLLSSDCTAHTLMRRRHRGCFYRHSLDRLTQVADRPRPPGRTDTRTDSCSIECSSSIGGTTQHFCVCEAPAAVGLFLSLEAARRCSTAYARYCSRGRTRLLLQTPPPLHSGRQAYAMTAASSVSVGTIY